MRIASRILLVVLLISLSGSVRPQASLPSLKQDKELRAIHQLAVEREDARDFPAAISILNRGIDLARQRGDRVSWAKMTANLGNICVKRSQYREAARAYLKALEVAESIGDRQMAGILAMSLSGVYYHLWAFEEAEQFAQLADQLLPDTGKPAWRARIWMSRGRLAFRRGRPEEGERLIRDGIRAAHAAPDPSLEAYGWELLGRQLLQNGRLEEAKEPLLTSLHIRRQNRDRDLYASLQTLASLHLALDNAQESLRLSDEALAAARDTQPLRPLLALHFDRARALSRLGRKVEAWGELSAAIGQIRSWRLHLLPSESVVQSAGAGVQEIYEWFIELGMDMHRSTGDNEPAWKAFAAAEETRAFSYRHSDRSSRAIRERLPTSYRKALSRLHAAEAALLKDANPANRRLVADLRRQIGEIELLFDDPDDDQPDPPQDIGPKLLSGLSRDEAILSFHLGPRHSFLWTMTREGFSAHRLPPASELARGVRLFREQVAGAILDARKAEELYRVLFGAIPKEVARKPRWRIVPDSALFDLPFAALVSRRDQDGPVHLVQDHSLFLMTTALDLEGDAPRLPRRGAMLAIADPVYNSADSRFVGARRTWWWPVLPMLSSFVQSPSDEGFELPRLPASANEAAACARVWRESGAEVYVLSGNDAKAESVKQALTHRPAVLHFATHLVPDPAARDETQIALSLGPGGTPELLGSMDVRAWTIGGALVVLSGCSSGAGRTLPGQGRSGLTRAWLSAGASGVVATYWPIPDGGGELMERFYENLLNTNSELVTADRALQSAQLAMIRSRPPYSNPSSWASYFVIGRKE